MRRLLLNMGSLTVAASALAAVHGAGAAAQEALTVEGNVAFVSDYRFRGVSQTGEEATIQGGLDLALDSGFYVGAWGSGVNFNNGTEIDVYGGYTFDAGDLSFDVGGLLYTYPGADDTLVGEIYGSVGATLGLVDTSVGLAYVPEQDNTGDEDNTYVYATGSMPLGASPFSLSGSIGYTDGAWDFSADGDGLWDWSLGVTTSVLGVDVGLSYVDTSEDFDGMSETAVLSISKAF